MEFLASDQSNLRIKLFSDQVNEKNNLIKPNSWQYPFDSKRKFIRPTDAKRVDNDGYISVIIATHGQIFEVPYESDRKVVTALTHRSCHSVEKLPDGNLLSVSSKHKCISIHYNRTVINDSIQLVAQKDYPLPFGHGVVFDKKRNYVWALGTFLRKYEYSGGADPALNLIKDYETPDKSGHDLFPSGKDQLLLTVRKGIYEFDIPSESFNEISDLRNVKSAVREMESGDIFITKPRLILGYKRWQTPTILNVMTNQTYHRPKARFYKVRLWQENEFSY